jgi:hypothetical protein
MAPIRETYEYGQAPPQLTATAVTSFAYNGLDATFAPVDLVNTQNEAVPPHTLRPYAGIVQAGVGVTYDISESTSIAAKAQVQKSFRPIGLERQDYTSLNTQVGFRFSL